MRAKMLVGARIVGDPDRIFAEGQEIEGSDAELQIALGHAEALPEPESEKPTRKAKEGASSTN